MAAVHGIQDRLIDGENTLSTAKCDQLIARDSMTRFEDRYTCANCIQGVVLKWLANGWKPQQALLDELQHASTEASPSGL
jgi:hypothetical protein